MSEEISRLIAGLEESNRAREARLTALEQQAAQLGSQRSDANETAAELADIRRRIEALEQQ